MKKITFKLPDGDTLVKTLAAHPFRWAFVLCMAVHFVFLSDISIYMTTYSLFAQQILLQVAGAVVLFRLKDKGKLNIIGFALAESVYAGGLFALFMLYSGSREKILFVQLASALLVCAAFGWFYKKIKESRYKEQLYSLFIMLLGFTVRMSYSLVTTMADRQHDLYDLKDNVYGGHIGYIKYIMDFRHIPNDVDLREVWQYYHPPLHYIISAVWASFNKYVLRLPEDHAITSIKTLSLFYSLCILILCYKLFRHFRFRGYALYIPLIIVSFCPQFIYFAGSMNNDALAAMFTFGAMVTALAWYRERSMKNILKIALCIGLGMMSKMSAALVAPAVAVLFLMAFIQHIKDEWKQQLGQFVCFGLVCVPLGLWFSIRNYLKWGIPLTYVQKLPEEYNSNSFYVGNIDLFKRIFDFSPMQYSYGNIYMNMENHVETTGVDNFVDYNPLVAMFKSSLFNEYFNSTIFGVDRIFNVISFVLFWVNIALALYAFVCMIRRLIKGAGISFTERAFPVLFHAILVFSFYSLSINYPYTYSMNFRYVSPLMAIGALFIGLCSSSEEPGESGEERNISAVERAVGVLTLVYAALCVVVIVAGCCPHVRVGAR